MDNLCLDPAPPSEASDLPANDRHSNDRPANDRPANDRFAVAHQIQHRLRRVHQRASAIFIDCLAAAQLTPTQWAVLATLQAEGPMSQNQLGRLTFMDPATTQGVIVRLVQRQLVVRHPDPVDRRRTSVQLTSGGELMVQRFAENAANAHRETLLPLSATEQTQFLDLLARMM